mgnify:FL=1
MTFQDVFTSRFLENMVSTSLVDAALAMVLAFLLGLFIFFIYKRTYSGVMYSASFGASLIALALITTLVILAVSSNVILSLGMVGALSIVRFRTPVKEAMDIVFLFWAIAVGIVLAAGLLLLAVLGSLFIGVVLIAISTRRNPVNPYILVLHCENADSEKTARELVEKHARALKLKSKTVLPDAVELNWEIRLKNDESSFVNELSSTPGVKHAALVSYNGDYMG